VTLDGWVADAARTFPVGAVSAEARNLLSRTEQALHAGVQRCHAGGRVGDISAAIQEVVERGGLSIVRSLVGHGVGRSMHEDPQVPNYGSPGKGPLLEEGMVLAIEPMTTAGRATARVAGDGWAIFSQDGSLAAHFEFTVAVTTDGPRILTPWHRAEAAEPGDGGEAPAAGEVAAAPAEPLAKRA
jgi:methionyl aminopeptidase